MVADPYKTLSLGHDASNDQIKRAYRKLAMKLHPDRLTQMNASSEEIDTATTRFATVTSAYSLLSDERRKRDYDHIYKYGGYDEETPEKLQTTSANPKKQGGAAQMGIGYSISDPFAYLMSQGKVRSTAVAGITIPSRCNMAHSPDGGFRLSFSSGQLKESPSGTLQIKSKTTQFAQGKKLSKVETTTVHNDGRKEIIIEGDDYVERRFSAAPRRRQSLSERKEEEKDDLTYSGDDLPWYMSAWNGLRDNLQDACVNPCGAISVSVR